VQVPQIFSRGATAILNPQAPRSVLSPNTARSFPAIPPCGASGWFFAQLVLVSDFLVSNFLVSVRWPIEIYPGRDFLTNLGLVTVWGMPA
jgi:hypothetical protein